HENLHRPRAVGLDVQHAGLLSAGRLPDRMPLVVRVAGVRRGSIRVAAVSRLRAGRAAVRLPGRPA
ncbi:hypothetical protein ACWEOZ_34580, partial [Actinoplanes sp. NPDC004185]